MNETIKADWCTWLRDPASKQGQGALRNEVHDPITGEVTGYSYCCLGGLTELAVRAGVTTWEDQKPPAPPAGEPMPMSWHDPNGPGRLGFYLSAAVREWAQIATDDPKIGAEGDRMRAARRNDNGQTFEQIARAIEAGVEDEVQATHGN